MAKRATMYDIAARAGVSQATVSNVINGRTDKVSPEVRQLILQTAKDLNYSMNLVARSLTRRRSDMLGLLLPIVDGEDTSLLLRDNPFYGEIISGVEYMATERGYDVLIKGVRPGESCKEWVLKRDLDGAIFIGNYTAVISEEMRELGSQLVLIDSYDEGTEVHSTIGIDDRKGGYLATKHLLELGHRGIALAASNILVDGAIHRRFQGFQDAMAEQGIASVKPFLYQDSLSFDGGYRIGKRLLERADVTAVFAVADVMAFGLMKAFYEAGKRIPDDLSIVGFDNTKGCEYANPALTSVAQPIYEKGMQAVEILTDAIRDSGDPVQTRILPVELKIRSSTKKGSLNPKKGERL